MHLSLPLANVRAQNSVQKRRAAVRRRLEAHGADVLIDVRRAETFRYAAATSNRRAGDIQEHVVWLQNDIIQPHKSKVPHPQPSNQNFILRERRNHLKRKQCQAHI